MTKEEYLEAKYEEHLYYWSNLAICIGSLVILSLIPLDYIATPSNLGRFFIYRIVTSVLMVLIYLLNRRKVDARYQNALSIIAGSAVAIMVALMIKDFGGHRSVYFAGYILIIIYVFGFLPLTFKISLLAGSIIYSIYLLPILFYDTITDRSFFISANIFIVSCIAALVILRYLSHLKLMEEFGLRYELEQQQDKLEEEVKERTVQLSATVGELKNEIAERKRLEAQLLHSEKMKAVGTLTGGIAHEFNNILTAIIGYGEILQDSISKGDPLRKYIDIIKTSAERASGLTRNLLAFSRTQVLKPRAVKINDVLERANNLLSKVIGEDIELRLVPADKDLTVFADPGQVEQILINLATNARDAMPDGGLLLIEASSVELDSDFKSTHSFGSPGKFALISITDSGTGMDEDTRRRIFEPFFTTKEVGKGTGLGLSTVYGIVKQSNGYINVYSEPGRGTTFKVYLPAVQSAAVETEASALSPERGGGETILIAEDDASVSSFIKDILDSSGYKTIVSGNGDAALEDFMQNRRSVDLLLLDVIMPKKNGKEVYETIRKIRPDIKALFLSGYSENIIHRKGVLEEGLNFLPKPVSKNDLLRRVRELLDS